ncbi:DUF6252 family protein [Flavobacterium silvaticum]|uniref:Lipoprotein n=1 Tax=Flavobacterium silvaticum TaxID=1852020 RepID=A0A972FK56_9FLAO|nr:DUF6252 family protein [Flavobacterium silvaticum]NMH27534.1 hypothetical protein [Flavobacterium silvaticum]
MQKLISCLILLILASCQKDDSPQNPVDQLPPITHSGEDTFGFLLNGEPISVTNSLGMTAIYQGGGIQFGSRGVYIVALDPFTVNVPYAFLDIGQGTARAEYTQNQACYYDEADTFEGSVTFLHINTVNYTISGTFEFSTVNDQCDTVRITNGRFDMRYTP